MRAIACSVLCLCGLLLRAQEHLMLNEALPGNRGITTDSIGRTPDWIELINPTNKPIDLDGWRIAMAGRQHVFTRSLFVAPRSYCLLWCDGRANDGADHITFKLAREGGALLLIAPDGINIVDMFSYPAIPGDVSIGRYPNGAKPWSFFTSPTPGSTNLSNEGIVHGRCAAPTTDRSSGHYDMPLSLALNADEDARINYTLDGSRPTREHGACYKEPITIASNTTVRAIAWREGYLTSAPMSATYILGAAMGDALSLNLAPTDLWNDSTGIYTTGLFNNNTRSGKAWEREGVVEWFGEVPTDVGVRISGSGSRGARKRSFKLIAREGAPFHFSDSTMVDEVLLRADATRDSWLRNTVVEELVRRNALQVEMQPSRTVALYLNAAYWGLYRWMPGKDATWLEQRSDAEALDVLEGPAAVALSGNDDHYQRAQAMLLRGAPADSLESMIDLGSLIDLACIDMWTGRADHDLNVRCYRPREKGGRWRWVLFDMDLWAPAAENSVERMCSAAAPETPFIPQLLAHRELQERTLARIAALQAAVFANAAAVADSIHHAHADELMDNYRRWELELDVPHPDTTLVAMKQFAQARPSHLFAHLARRTGRKLRTTIIEAPPSDMAIVLIDGLPLSPGRHDVQCFSGVHVPLEVRPANGQEFAGWKGVDLRAAEGSVDLGRTRSIRPLLRSVVP